MTDQFTLDVLNEEKRGGVTYIYVHATDRFSRARYRLQRRAVGLFAGVLERYLRRHPQLKKEKNLARRLIYIAPAIRAWSAYMPGGFATYSVHNPDHRRLKNGQMIDPVTRNFFRHSYDAIGLRSRAYAMSWFIHQEHGRSNSLNWLSIACGTGQPTFDAARLFQVDIRFFLVDQDTEALQFARRLAIEYGIADDTIVTKHLNITDDIPTKRFLVATQPDIIEAMGLFEYLSRDEAVRLLAVLRSVMTPGRVLVFTNMRPEHPHLNVHQRGLGWPGVIQRTPQQVRSLLRQAGFIPEEITVILPDDNVYAVYGITAKNQ